MSTADNQDHTPVGPGKHAGKTWSDIAEIDPAYVVWAHDTWHPDAGVCSDLLYRECVNDVAENRRQTRVSRDQDES